MRGESDVHWFFVESDAVSGLKSMAFDAGASRVFDAVASSTLHASMREPRHRKAVDRRCNIARALAKLHLVDVDTLRLAYEPRGYAWDNPLAECIVRRRLVWSQASLVGVAVHLSPHVSPFEALRRLQSRATCGDPLCDVRIEAMSLVRGSLGHFNAAANTLEAKWW